ncbi:hypothetical protein ACFLZH_02785 [Patescibacteria group bacterium]
MNDLNKKQKEPKNPKQPEALEGELAPILRERSIDRLLEFTLDRVSDDAKSVLNLDHMVPEGKKWEERENVRNDFKEIGNSLNEISDNPLVKDKEQKIPQKLIESMFKKVIGELNEFEIMLNSTDAANALGREFIFILNYIVDTIRNQIEILIATVQNQPENFHKALDEFLVFRHTFMDKAMKGLTTQVETSDPVQIQFFNNMTDALDIPEFPLNEISNLYEDFHQREASEDFSQVLRIKMDEYVDLNREQLQAEIDKERDRALKVKKDFAELNENFKAILTSYADYWMQMTPEKLYRYILKRRAIENLTEGRVTIAQIEELSKKLKEMQISQPTGQLTEEEQTNIALKQQPEFKKWEEQEAQKPPIDAEAMAEADKIHIEVEEPEQANQDDSAQKAGFDSDGDFGDLFADEEEEPPPRAASEEIPKGEGDAPPYKKYDVDEGKE